MVQSEVQLGEAEAQAPPAPAVLLETLSGRFEFMLGSEPLDKSTDATREGRADCYCPSITISSDM